MRHLKITPDHRLNNKEVEQLASALCIYESPLERMEGRKITPAATLSFETILTDQDAAFYVTIPERTESLARKAIETTWPRAAVEEAPDPLGEEPDRCSKFSLQHHHFLSLKTYGNSVNIMQSILETKKAMEPGEQITLQTIATPAEKDWYAGAASAYERFKSGSMPQKLQLNKKNVTRGAIKAAAATALGVADITTELITGKPMEKIDLHQGERAAILKDGHLTKATLDKTRGDAFIVEIRMAIRANNSTRAAALERMMNMAMRQLDGDNRLECHHVKTQRLWDKITSRKMSSTPGRDYLSVQELSRLHVLPNGELQERYKVTNIDQTEVDVGKELTEGGLLLGTVTHKRKERPVYQQTENEDILCLPRIVIGGMGSGKTKGYAANFIVEAVQNGYGALAIDPAKGEIGEEIRAALPADKVIEINLGEKPVSLDWREVAHTSKAKNRLANTILGFFNTADAEAGAQTSRYIRAAVMAMRTGKLAEIIRILEDQEYRDQAAASMPETIHKSTLEAFSNESDRRQAQIIAPIYNRLDIILGDEYLNECMSAQDGLDMVELMSQKKAIIINAPKRDLGPEAVDLIVNLLSTKIDLAMTIRKAQHPFFIVFDEPHQFLRSEKIWRSAAVESRKWRVGYTWLFHSWEQIPNNLAEIIKAAGPHYTLYNSSKKTFRDLKEEIHPIEPEEGMRLKQYHAISVLRAGDRIQKPFIARMTPPPSKRFRK